MTDQEANQIIAEYMFPENKMVRISTGESCFEQMLAPHYHQSLDALIPVWDKLEYVPLFKQGRLSKTYWCKVESIHIGNPTFCSPEGIETIQEAAAIATAKAIKALE